MEWDHLVLVFLQSGIKMSKFYSKTTGGFYDDAINSTKPADAVEVSEDLYNFCFSTQAAGGSITSDERGNPVGIPNPVSYERADIIRQISALENQITPRRRDEAILGTDGGWLAAKRAEISALRATLPAS